MSYLRMHVSHDRSEINLNQENDIRYWTKRFGCSAEELEQAIRKVGNSAAEVQQLLQNMRKQTA